MNRTYRQRTRLNLNLNASRPLLREEPPAYPAPPGPGREDNGGGDDEDELDQFLRYLRTIEAEPTSTLSRQLIRAGIELPAPDSFTEESVHPKLWEVLRALADHRTFLCSTDHLSDLELYRYLWEVTLNEPNHELDDSMGDCACQIDLVSSGSDESMWIYHRYYADEAERWEWSEAFPDDPMPDRIDPPFDRDRHLPKRESHFSPPPA